MTRPVQLCTFCLDGMLFGIEVERVREAILDRPRTPIPLVSAIVGGLMNLRGEIVPAIDLRRRLGLAERGADGPPVSVLVQTPEGPVGLLVDEAADVIEVVPEAFEEPPETLRGDTRKLIRGTYKLSDRLLLVLDVDAALALPSEP